MKVKLNVHKAELNVHKVKLNLHKAKLNVHKAKLNTLVKSLKFPPPTRGRVRVGAISDCISGCSFPLPQGEGKMYF